MKFCVSSRTAGPRPLAETLVLASQLGYAGVEVWTEDLARTGEQPVGLRHLAHGLGLRLLVHADTRGVNLASRRRGRRRESLERCQRALQVAADLGAALMVVHPGKAEDGRAGAAWLLLLEGIAELVRQAERLGVAVGVEHMEPGGGQLVCSPDDARLLFERLPSARLGLTLDLAHAANWSLAMGGSVLEFIRRAERVLHVHLSDNRPDRHHVPLGEGVLDLRAMLDVLRQRGYDGTVTIEGRAQDREVAALKANRRFLEGWQAGVA